MTESKWHNQLTDDSPLALEYAALESRLAAAEAALVGRGRAIDALVIERDRYIDLYQRETTVAVNIQGRLLVAEAALSEARALISTAAPNYDDVPETEYIAWWQRKRTWLVALSRSATETTEAQT